MFDCVITVELNRGSRKHFLKRCNNSDHAYQIAERLIGKSFLTGLKRYEVVKSILRINIWDDIEKEWKDFNKYGKVTGI